MHLHETCEKGNVVIACIQCRDIVEVAAARIAENVAILHRGFLERLETVGREAGAKHVQPFEAAAAEFGPVILEP